MSEILLDVKNLCKYYPVSGGTLHAVDDVSFHINKGETPVSYTHLGGTLFLDEIGEISLAIQTKLLRALQEREVRRIGDDKVISVNVRIISATNKNLTRLTGRGDFRRDLMYRLDVLRLLIPPLRKRGQDAWLLFGRLLDSYGADRMGAPAMEPEACLLYTSRCV